MAQSKRKMSSIRTVAFICMLLALNVCPSAASPLLPALSLAAKVAVPYSLFSALVDVYAGRKVKAMAEVPSPLDLVSDETEELPSIQELRKTISPFSNLVEQPRHRLLWNRWAARALSQGKQQQQPISDLLTSSDTSTEYSFAYRSYVNFEEKGAICKALRSWYVFTSPVVARDKGRITFIRPNDNEPLQVVQVEKFRSRGFQPGSITWRGTVVENPGGVWDKLLFKTSFPRVEWTSTEVAIGRGSQQQVNHNHPVAERLRQLPWDIVDIKDGMVLFQRGSVGVLAYDRE